MLIILFGPLLAAVLFCLFALIIWHITFIAKLIFHVGTTSALIMPSSSSHSTVHHHEIQKQIENKKKIIIAKEKYAARRKKYCIGNIRIVQRAVVIVGGDFARSPRMMYHATSLSDRHVCGHLFDEVVLVGYEDGNLLAEPLRSRSKGKGVTKLVMSATLEGDVGAEYLDENALLNIDVDTTSCIMKKVEVPDILSYWVVGTLYRTIIRTARLILTLLPLCIVTIRSEKVVASCSKSLSSPASSSIDEVAAADDDQLQSRNEEYLGREFQVVVTSLVICQTPPAIPFLPILQLMVRVVGPLISFFTRLLFVWLQEWDSKCKSETQEVQHDYPTENGGEPASEGLQNDSVERQQNTIKSPKPNIFSPFDAFTECPRVIVDWHNIGYTLLEIDQRPNWMIQIYRFVEKYYGVGDINLTVSDAMKCTMSAGYEPIVTEAEVSSSDQNDNLKKDNNDISGEFEDSDTVTSIPSTKKKGLKCNFNFPVEKIEVLRDRAPAFFSPCSREVLIRDVILPGFGKELEKNNIDEEDKGLSIEERLILSNTVPEWVFKSNLTRLKDTNTDKAFTEREIRGRIIVSSTSWTSDDDYTMVLDALLLLNVVLIAQNGSNSCNLFDRCLWLVITGKGATREVFEKQLAEDEKYNPLRESPYITISTIYFQEYAQYAKMLGGSDIGLSLHASSSGYDLPMKCVDMFGAGLPVLALYYPAIVELVDERGGWLFEDAYELGDILIADVMGMMPCIMASATFPSVIAEVDVKREIHEDPKKFSLALDGINDKEKSEVDVEGELTSDQNKTAEDEYDFCGYTPRYNKKARVKKIEDVGVVPNTTPIPPQDPYWSKCEERLQMKAEFVATHQGIKWSESWERHALPSIERLLAHNILIDEDPDKEVI